jgi:hypothetical protein
LVVTYVNEVEVAWLASLMKSPFVNTGRITGGQKPAFENKLD